MSFGPTVLPASATGAETKCPDREQGPCTGARLVSPNAPMTAWPPAVAQHRAVILGRAGPLPAEVEAAAVPLPLPVYG